MRALVTAIVLCTALSPIGSGAHEATDLAVTFAGEGEEPPNAPKDPEDGLAITYEFTFHVVMSGEFEGVPVASAYAYCYATGNHHIRATTPLPAAVLYSGPLDGDFSCRGPLAPVSFSGHYAGSVDHNNVTLSGGLNDADGTPHFIGCEGVLGPGYFLYGIVRYPGETFSLEGVCRVE